MFTSGGVAFSTSEAESELTSTQALLQLGGRIWLTDLFELQAGITYQGLTAAEAAIRLRPFSGDIAAEPYLALGFGRYFLGQENERAVIPVAAGLLYPWSRRVGLHVEMAGRWTLVRDVVDGLSTLWSFAPTVGVSYNIGGAKRPAREQFIPASREPTASEEPVVDPVATEPAETADHMPAADSTQAAASNDMVRVPDGTFIMGLTDEDPLSLQTAGLKRVTVTSFYVDQFEVTNADYRSFLSDLDPQRRQVMLPDSTVWQETNNRIGWSRYFRSGMFDDHPVAAVTFDQARAYCAAQDKRLLTEAEWEYAARSGEIGRVYPWKGLEPRGEQGEYLANYNPGRGGYAADGYAFTAPVDAFPPNDWGLYATSGNVAEWVQDAYTPTFSVLSDFNPVHEDPEESRRVVRGGSWASDAFYIGVGVRDTQDEEEASAYVGIRCGRDVAQVRDEGN